jgi:hypothetical protein|tara:strand:+ start:5819 stop:5983 length:165 start_codon:yes stop_codon:yes gene_type:complete
MASPRRRKLRKLARLNSNTEQAVEEAPSTPPPLPPKKAAPAPKKTSDTKKDNKN